MYTIGLNPFSCGIGVRVIHKTVSGPIANGNAIPEVTEIGPLKSNLTVATEGSNMKAKGKINTWG